MKHQFSVVYDLDTTVAIAVGAYLDCEHYTHLHRKWTDSFEILEREPLRMTVRQTWRMFGFFPIGQVYVAEYVPPARFKNYAISPHPFWWPSIHHLVKISTDLKYSENAETGTTRSRLDVEVEIPFLLWPLRKWIEKAITQLKIKKDEEDIAMMTRRAQLFGRRNHSAYLLDHQFLLFKDHYVRHFGKRSEVASS